LVFICRVLQYNLDSEAPGIRTYQSELRVLSTDEAGLDQVEGGWTSTHRIATLVSTGCDVVDVFRPRHDRGVQTVVEEQVTSHVAPGQTLVSEAITDPQTGRRMNLADAVRSGLLDVAGGGQLNDVATGRKLSVSEAVRLGYVDEALGLQLQRASGMRDPTTGRELSVLDAMQQGYIDVTSGKVVDPRTSEQLVAADAAKRGLLSSDVASGLSRDSVTARSTHLVHGYYGALDFPSTELPALPLHDVVDKDVYDVRTGRVTEPVTQHGLTLSQAVAGSVVTAGQREVYDPTTGDVITLAQAVSRGIIDPHSGTYVDVESRRAMRFDEAVDRKLIEKPLSLHAALTGGLMTANGQLLDATAGGLRRLSLLEAVDRGLLDTELKCILDTRTNELLSLREAIQRGLINEHGHFVDRHTGSAMPLPAAVNQGLAHVVQKDVSFANRLIVDSETGGRLTLTEAIAAGIIDPAARMYVDRRTGEKMSLDEAERRGLIERGFARRLVTPTGYRDASGKQMSALELVGSRAFDPATGQLTDPHSGRALSLEEAVSLNLIGPSDAALLLKATSPVISTTTITSQIQYGRSADGLMSVEEALKAGVVQNGNFTDPSTGKTMSVNQAVHLGLLREVFDSDVEPFDEVPSKRSRSEVVGAGAAGVATLSTVNAQHGGVDEHQQSEDTEEYTQQIADGTERVRRRETREFHGRRTEDGGYESVLMQQRHVSSLASTRSVTGLSGRPDLPMSFSDAITIGFLNPDTGYVRDPTTGEDYSVETALAGGLLDSETASFVDPESSKNYDISTAIGMGLLEPTARYCDQRSKERLSLSNLLDRGIVTTQSRRSRGGTFDWRQSTIVSVVDPETGLDIPSEEARRRGVLDTENGTYRNTRTREVLSLETAVRRGLVKVSEQPASGTARSLHETKSYTVVGAIDADSRTRVDVNTALQRGIIDEANGLYVGKDDAGNRFEIPISEAIRRGLVFTEAGGAARVRQGSRFINTTKTFSVESVIDPTTGDEISVTEAIQRGIVDQTTGLYTHPATGEVMPITEAVNRGLVVADVRESTVTAREPADQASEILVSREVAYTLRSVIDPRTNAELSIAEATSLGILDRATSEFRHPVTDELMSLDEAIARGLVRVERGRPSDRTGGETREEKVPSIHIDDEADAREDMCSEELSEERRTFQISGVEDPESGDMIPLNEAIEKGLVDESGGVYIDPTTNQRMPISSALERGLIVGQLVHKTDKKQLFLSSVVASRIDDIATVFNPLTGTQIPVSQAIHLGLIGRDLASYYNPATDESMSIDEAVRRGLAVTRAASAGRKTATDGVMAVVDWDSGMIVERSTGRELSPAEAVRRGLIDETTARMIDERQTARTVGPEPDETPDEDVRIVIRTTEVVEQPPTAITIEETITATAGPLTEKSFEGQLSFDAAVKLGLFSVRTRKFFNPLTGDVMSLSDAVGARLINPKLPALVDLRAGRVYTLDQALDRQLIGVQTGRLDTSRVAGANVTLDPRFLADVDWQLQLNVEDALACRLFDVESGLLLHPVTRRKLTLSDATRDGVIVGDATVVLNIETGARMSLTEALAAGLIDGQTGKMTLSAGVVGESSAGEISLLLALSYGLLFSYCPADSTTVLDNETGEKLPIDDAIRRGVVREQSAIVYSPRSRQRVSVKRAVQLGIVDQQTLHFCDPDTKRRVAPVDAARLGLMSLPGAPVLSDVARMALIQSAFETDVATEADARLKEKVTELAEAVLAGPLAADKFAVAATPQKGGDSKIVQSSTETEPATVTVDDGVLRMTKRTTTTVEKTQTKESTLEPAKHLAQLTDVSRGTPPSQRPTGAQTRTPSSVTPTPEMADLTRPQSKEPVTTTPSRITPDMEALTTTSTGSVDGRTTPMDVDGVIGGRRARQLPQIPAQARQPTPTTKQTVDITDGQLEAMAAGEALRLGLVEIDWKTGLVKNTRTGEVLTGDEALRRGLIDSHIKSIIDNRLRHGALRPGDVISLNDALTTGLLLVPLGRIRDPVTNQRMTVEEAVDVGLLDPDCSLIIDPGSQRAITLTDAQRSGLMDFHSGDVKNTATGKTLTLTEMALQGYIPERGLAVAGTPGAAVIDISRRTVTTVTRDGGGQTRPAEDDRQEPFSTLTLYEAAERDLIDMDTGYFRHPVTGELMSLSDAVMRGFISVPLREGDLDVVGIDFEEAIRRGLIDIRNNTFTEPMTEVLMPLDAAIRNGYVIVPESGIQLRITEEKEELVSRGEVVDECRTVGEMCGDGVIQFTRTTETRSSVDDVPRGVPLLRAVADKLLDVETGLFTDSYTQRQMNFAEAVYGGFIEPRSAKVGICIVLYCISP